MMRRDAFQAVTGQHRQRRKSSEGGKQGRRCRKVGNMNCIAINLLVKVLLLLMNRYQLVVKCHLELFWIICQRVSVLRSLGPPTELLCWWPQNEVPLQMVVAGESLGPWFTRQEKGPRWTR